MYDLIEKKRDGHALSEKEINFFIENYTNGNIPDYQASALLMAIYFQGMNEEESAQLTLAMAQSGKMLDLSEIDGIIVDKHSTGGVGDTTSIILAPLVASLGVKVAKMSGRGLGHTGGTIDKLEAINGFNVSLDETRFIQQVNEHGIALIGQTNSLAPADQRLYSLRDVTATVNSIPLIASSIMSKKIAAGAQKIVLDVKTGSGAFMQQFEDAQKLAKTMVNIGNLLGKETVAIISNMDEPLGECIGNAIEIEEAIQTLQGKGPADLTELVIELGAHMTVLANVAETHLAAKKQLHEQLHNGRAFEYFRKWITLQGGDENVVTQPERLPKARFNMEVTADRSGYVTQIKTNELGRAAMVLGAGRRTKDDTIDLAVGLKLHKKIGHYVERGEPICTIFANEEKVDHVEQMILQNITISSEQNSLPLILDIIK